MGHEQQWCASKAGALAHKLGRLLTKGSLAAPFKGTVPEMQARVYRTEVLYGSSAPRLVFPSRKFLKVAIPRARVGHAHRHLPRRRDPNQVVRDPASPRPHHRRQWTRSSTPRSPGIRTTSTIMYGPRETPAPWIRKGISCAIQRQDGRVHGGSAPLFHPTQVPFF
jgi:hypothetical protein